MELYAIPALLQEKDSIKILAALAGGWQTVPRLLALTGLASEQLKEGLIALRQGGYLDRAPGLLRPQGRYYRLTPFGRTQLLAYVELLERMLEQQETAEALWDKRQSAKTEA